jgi:hypothetical protein
MTCSELTNDVMLAPTAEASSHLAGCEECRERQRAVSLAVRALRALADERPVPKANEDAIFAALPQLAADAARRRPAAWWQVGAAAAVLMAAILGGLKFAGERETPPADRVAERTDAPEPLAFVKPPPVTDPSDPKPPVDPVPPVKPDPVVKPQPDPDPDPPPPGHGFLAGGELPPLPKPPVDPVPPPQLPQPAGLLDDVSVADCMDIMRTVLGEGEPVSRDYNGDGRTDVADALIAAKRIAEKEDMK